MKTTDFIHVGDELSTAGGYIVITSTAIDWMCAYVEEHSYVFDPDTDEEHEEVSEYLIALSDIADRLKEVDHKNHKVRWAEEDDEEEDEEE